MVLQERLHTAAELWELTHDPAHEDKRLELLKGVLFEMSLAGGEHGEIAGKFFLRIGVFVEQHNLGRMTAAETGYLLATDPDTVQGPDVGFVAIQRAPDGLPIGHIPFAPDLAVEVVSPNDRPRRLLDKIEAYLEAGTQLVWVAYPSERVVDVWQRAEGGLYKQKVEMGGVLEGGDVLPGFRLPLSDVFPVNDS